MATRSTLPVAPTLEHDNYNYEDDRPLTVAQYQEQTPRVVREGLADFFRRLYLADKERAA